MHDEVAPFRSRLGVDGSGLEVGCNPPEAGDCAHNEIDPTFGYVGRAIRHTTAVEGCIGSGATR